MKRLVFLGLVVLTAGCSNCDPETNDNDAGEVTDGAVADSIPLDQFCANVRSGLINNIRTPLEACGTKLSDAEFERFPLLATTTIGDVLPLVSCDSTTDGGLGIATDVLAASVQAGRMSYDAEKAGKCRAEGRRLRAAGGLADAGLECVDIFVGNVALGGACSLSEECAADAYCKPSSNASCSGTCVARLAVDTPCRPTSDLCADGARCMDVAGQFKCVAPAGLNESCVSRDCASGLACIQDVCVSPGDVGATCVDLLDSGDCRDGLACVRGSAGTATCVQRANLGESCGATADDGGVPCVESPCVGCNLNTQLCAAQTEANFGCAEDGDCDPLSFCNDSKVCEKRHDVSQACVVRSSFLDQRGSCLFGDTWCKPDAPSASTGVCTLIPKLGDPCETSSGQPSCKSGFCKTSGGSSGTCTAYPSVNEACGAAVGTYECQGDAFCNDSTCEAPRANGLPCNADDHCASGRCDDTLRTPACAARKGAGEACTDNDECDPDLVCDPAERVCSGNCTANFGNGSPGLSGGSITVGGCGGCPNGMKDLSLWLFFALVLLPRLRRRR